ncbi:hypothetical protein LAZ67_X001963 [Cordylochernes scorpioides]|uniref:Integrase catalytic domain-containing protein n=1 Tax=Cordylochernes scorpioides TaxID=51811 RepID=A0ABY6LX41_9ARAC|nr:hypothetical protein LAZ67_X001963 [Cordylochernes scorpioides]
MILIHIIQSKLDRSIRKEWEMSFLEKEYPSYEKMISFLERFAGSLGSFQNKENSKQFYKMNKSTHSHSATFASDSSIDSRVKSCVLCKGEHVLLKCPKFNGMMLPERWTFVKDNSLCYNCLRSNHRVSSCVFTQNCKLCNKRHHTLLHQFKPEMLSPVANISPLTHASVSCFADNKSHDRILLSTALIKVKSENGVLQTCRALIDTGSKSWIKSEYRHWKPFVGNRIAEVQRLTLHSSWHYVISKDNPAECASRVRKCHLDHLHSGLQLTMSALRLRYWIPAGRSLVKKIIHQCMVYFRAKRQVTKQIMGDLPMHRIVKSNPFTKIGIDFAGQFLMKPNIKKSKVKLKSYVALFVCFCTKAIHIEIVSDLSSAAFLAAFKRFISRRGKPSDIFSDNGTNFRGANNILREQFGILKASTIQKFKWHFIPPSAPNFGGIWEAGIKSFKFHLLRCLKSQILKFEELSTLTTQIEACLNSRPICPLSSDSDDFNPLTPGHFLIGRPLTAPPESNDDDNVPINYLDRCSLSDLILLKDTISPPAMYWSLGRITKVFPGADGKVRVIEVKTKHQERLTRTVSKIVPLPFAED